MIIVFVIDTSASMNQRSLTGMTLLDCAKSMAEHFVKQRSRDPTSRTDRYFLVTTSSKGASSLFNANADAAATPGPLSPSIDSVRAGWKDNYSHFAHELRGLVAHDLSDIGTALKKAFELLNQYRLQTGIDNYGVGRYPWFLDPAACILITDGEKFISADGSVTEDIVISCDGLPGQELTLEPFRWDQRVFTVCLRVPGVKKYGNSRITDAVTPCPASLKALCETTGGTSMTATNVRAGLHCMDSIVAKLQYQGVVVDLAPDSSTVSAGTEALPSSIGPPDMSKAFLHVRTAGKDFSWPLPEAFRVDRTLVVLPARSAHPSLFYQKVLLESLPLFASNSVLPSGPSSLDSTHISNTSTLQTVLDKLAFPQDKYEVLAGVRDVPQVNTRWPVYVKGSLGDNGLGEPVGYITTSNMPGAKSLVVSLVVLPYNFPRLFVLLADAVKYTESGSGNAAGMNSAGSAIVFSKLPTPWRQAFNAYITSIPIYYYPSLKKVLRRYNLHTLVPEIQEGGRSYQVNGYLLRLRDMTKAENDNILSTAELKQKREKEMVSGSKPPTRRQAGAQSLTSTQLIDHILNKALSHVQEVPLQNMRAVITDLRAQLSGKEKSQGGISVTGLTAGDKEPCHISRGRQVSLSVADQWAGRYGRMAPSPRAALEDGLHAVPVAEMGNYQPVLLKREAPRDPLSDPEPDEDTIAGLRRRQLQVHFGNPYRRNASLKNAVSDGEEAGEALLLNVQSNKGKRSRKRQRAALLNASSRLASGSLQSLSSSVSANESETPLDVADQLELSIANDPDVMEGLSAFHPEEEDRKSLVPGTPDSVAVYDSLDERESDGEGEFTVETLLGSPPADVPASPIYSPTSSESKRSGEAPHTPSYETSVFTSERERAPPLSPSQSGREGRGSLSMRYHHREKHRSYRDERQPNKLPEVVDMASQVLTANSDKWQAIRHMIRSSRTTAADIQQIVDLIDSLDCIEPALCAYISLGIRTAVQMKKTRIVDALRSFAAARNLTLAHT